MYTVLMTIGAGGVAYVVKSILEAHSVALIKRALKEHAAEQKAVRLLNLRRKKLVRVK